MDLKELLSSFAQITVFAMMLSMGMVLGFAGMGRLWRRPSLLVRCILAAFVVVPLAAMVVTKVLPLPFEVRAGIAAMAVIPGAPVIYRKMLKGPGDAELAGTCQATMALLSIALVPLWFGIISALYPTVAAAPLAVVFKQVMLVQGIPLLAGAAIAHWVPELAEDLNEPLNRISSTMLIGVVLLVVVMGLSLVLKAGPLPIFAVVLMAAAGLLAGHYLGGTDPVQRQTLAIANGSRNAGLALALITLNFPTVAHEVLVTIAAYAVVSAIASKIYTHLYQKRLSRSGHAQNAPGV